MPSPNSSNFGTNLGFSVFNASIAAITVDTTSESFATFCSSFCSSGNAIIAGFCALCFCGNWLRDPCTLFNFIFLLISFLFYLIVLGLDERRLATWDCWYYMTFLYQNKRWNLILLNLLTIPYLDERNSNYNYSIFNKNS